MESLKSKTAQVIALNLPTYPAVQRQAQGLLNTEHVKFVFAGREDAGAQEPASPGLSLLGEAAGGAGQHHPGAAQQHPGGYTSPGDCCSATYKNINHYVGTFSHFLCPSLYLADPGEARDCSTNSFIFHLFILSLGAVHI